jgi:hypothetical protein
MAVVNLGGSGTIYDPNLPQRVAQQPAAPQNSVMPNTDQVAAPSAQQDNFPVPMDPGIAAMLARAAAPQQQPSLATSLNYSPSPLDATPRGDYSIGKTIYRDGYPIGGEGAPGASPTPWFTSSNTPTQWGGAAPATPPVRPAAARPAAASNTGPGGADVGGVFSNLPDNVFNGANAVQTAQAPNSATPQGWNLFAALGQALSHLLGFNAQGQPQGMSGLVRNPVQAAPSQTAALRMPTPAPSQAARYQGRTLLG